MNVLEVSGVCSLRRSESPIRLAASLCERGPALSVLVLYERLEKRHEVRVKSLPRSQKLAAKQNPRVAEFITRSVMSTLVAEFRTLIYVRSPPGAATHERT